MRTCPNCGAKLYEDTFLLYPGNATEPPDYREYSLCISCFWSDKSVVETEEIPF